MKSQNLKSVNTPDTPPADDPNRPAGAPFKPKPTDPLPDAPPVKLLPEPAIRSIRRRLYPPLGGKPNTHRRSHHRYYLHFCQPTDIVNR